MPVPQAMILKAGDYIKYDTGVTTLGDNGVVMFRVLYPMDSEYGLQIISDKYIGERIKLGGGDWETGKEGYNKVIKELNIEAEKYVNPTYAYDGRSVGTIPTIIDGKFGNKNEGAKTTVKLPPSNWTTYIRPTGWISDDTNCYEGDSNYETDQEALTKANLLATGERYWLASRYVVISSSYMTFDIRLISSSGELKSGGVSRVEANGTTSGYSNRFGFRPCISLKTDVIKITNGDGNSEETAYTIGI